MLMTPVFSALYGPAVGISLCLLLEVAVALPLLPAAVRLVDWRQLGLLLAAAVVCVPLGTYLLTLTEPEPMRWAISAIVLAAAGLLASGWRYPGRPRPVATLAAGATSGFLNGLSGTARRSPFTISPARRRRRTSGPTSRLTLSSSTLRRLPSSRRGA